MSLLATAKVHSILPLSMNALQDNDALQDNPQREVDILATHLYFKLTPKLQAGSAFEQKQNRQLK